MYIIYNYYYIHIQYYIYAILYGLFSIYIYKQITAQAKKNTNNTNRKVSLQESIIHSHVDGD